MVKERFRIGWLYPDLMNIYGDRGNVSVLAHRTGWRGYRTEVVEIGLGECPDLERFDILFMGGGQDREQALVFRDFARHKAVPLAAALEAGAVMLTVCGGYQAMGHYYRTADGHVIEGLGLLDLHTEAGPDRCIGNVVLDCTELGISPETVVGFENHRGRTRLGEGLRPLGRVLKGFGNNGEDGYEGCRWNNLIGTYLHGSLLPKNPHLADWLIARALERRGITGLEPLDDRLELTAHRQVAERELAVRG